MSTLRGHVRSWIFEDVSVFKKVTTTSTSSTSTTSTTTTTTETPA